MTFTDDLFAAESLNEELREVYDVELEVVPAGKVTPGARVIAARASQRAGQKEMSIGRFKSATGNMAMKLEDAFRINPPKTRRPRFPPLSACNVLGGGVGVLCVAAGLRGRQRRPCASEGQRAREETKP